jgi:AP2-like factor (ANT lineage)
VAEAMRKHAAPRSSRFHGVTRWGKRNPRAASLTCSFIHTAVICVDSIVSAVCHRRTDRLKWSGKFEAHLWDNASQVQGRKRKGKHGACLLLQPHSPSIS